MIIDFSIPYSSIVLENNINALIKTYPFLEKKIIGYSVLGKPIYCIVFGQGQKEVFYSGSIHANEWIVSPVLMKFIEDFCIAYSLGTSIYGFDSRKIFQNNKFYIVPIINPDGVDLVTGALSSSSTPYIYAKEISNNFPSIPFPDGWKANINGVDLNLQFPAGWENAKEIKYSQGFTSPAPRDFVGYGPLTEPEALAIYSFTLEHNFRLVIAYHTQGEEIYWNFQNINPPQGFEIGQKFANSSGYLLTEVPYNSSLAGYKDWFIQTYNRPGYTIEAGLGENPLPLSQFSKIYKDNFGILVLGSVL